MKQLFIGIIIVKKKLCLVCLNPHHLRELDLRGNDPGESGVKLLLDLKEDAQCKLENIR